MADIPQKSKITVHISLSTMLRVIAVLLVLFFAYAIRDVLILLLVSIVFATAFDPWVDRLQRWRIPRPLGIISLYIFVLAVVAVILGFMIPPIFNQVTDLSQNFPSLYQKFVNEFSALRDFSARIGLEQNFLSLINSLRSSIGQASSGVFGALTSFFGGIISFVAVVVLTYYLVSEENGMRRFFRSVAPVKYQPFLNQLLVKVQFRIGGWLRGQLLLLLIVAVMDLIGMWIIGVKFALILALFAGLLEFVPMIGSTIAIFPAAFIAFTQSVTKGLLTIILFIVVQQVENNIIVPKVMKTTTGLHSLVIIIVLLIGGKIAGLLGILLAIPITLIISTIYIDLFSRKSIPIPPPETQPPADPSKE